jgi:tetratricopeptide (TPR) repeat protein
MTRATFWGCSGIVLLWGASFVASCRLAVLLPAPAATDAGSAVLGALMGSSRAALGHQFYETADTYFHRGVGHKRERAFTDAPFQRIKDEISPHAHVHLEGDNIGEIMPWLRFAISADPGRAETYLVAAFWLATDARRPDLALDLLNEAQWNCPFSYEVQFEKGRLHLHAQRIREARQAFDAGLAFWPGDLDPESEDARHDRAGLLLYRALIHEADGERDKAVAALEEILSLFPERRHLLKRIADLRSGEQPALLAGDYLQQLVEEDRDERRNAPCGRDEHEHDHDHDEDHDGHEHEH